MKHDRRRSGGFNRELERKLRRLLDRDSKIERNEMYRDPKNSMFKGVCSSIARRLELPFWGVRLAAVVGLFTIPTLIIPAYIIGCFVIPKREEIDNIDRILAEEDDDVELYEAKQRYFDHLLNDDDSADLAKKRSQIRHFRARFDRLEQRLQSMEGYVTSSQYKLDREFRNI